MGCGAATSIQHPEQLKNQPLYIRKQLIGKGTYGFVYRCISVTDQLEYAMKVIKINSKTRQDAIKQVNSLKTQISLLKKLTHNNIVSYKSFDISENKEQVQIVMELVKGGSLKDYINKNGPLTQNQVVEKCKYLLQALIYLHQQSIIHRDLKCANILLTQDLIPKITDFGTAKIIPKQDNDDIAKLSASLKGTPYYMAPQILKRIGHNQMADIWSFGCLVIQMLTGKAPWTGISSNFQQIIGYISSGIHPPFPPKITKQCQYFLQSCLDPIPSNRLKAYQLIKHRFIDKTNINSPRPGKQLKAKSRVKNQKIKTEELVDIVNNQNQGNVNSVKKKVKQIDYELQYNYQTAKKNKDNFYDIKQNSYTGKKETGFKSNKKNKKQNSFQQMSLEINDISQEDIVLQDKYFIKQTLQSLKRKKNAQKNAKTTETIKNGQENLYSVGNSQEFSNFNLRSYTQMSAHQKVISTSISRAERNRYIQQQKIFRKKRQQQKRKWQQQLKEGAQFLKKQNINRYISRKF